jgi:hypothetical protein
MRIPTRPQHWEGECKGRQDAYQLQQIPHDLIKTVHARTDLSCEIGQDTFHFIVVMGVIMVGAIFNVESSNG